MVTINPIDSQNPIQVADGGLGVSTLTTAYAPVCAGTTATGPVQVASTGLGTSGNVLTSNGSSAVPSFQSVAGTLSLIQTITASGSPANITFSTGIASPNTTYFLVFSNVVASAANSNLSFLLYVGGNYTGAGYESGNNLNSYNLATWFNFSATSSALVSYTCLSTTNVNGYIWFHNLASSNKPIWSGQLFGTDSATVPQEALIFGNNSTTGGVSGLQFYFINGSTFTSGTFSLYALVQ